MNLTTAGRVWNRAALEAGGNAPRPGDRALASLLLLHGLVMNGGVQHAIEALDPDDLHAAIDGFAFFGFDDVAAFLGSVAANLDSTGAHGDDERVLDHRYSTMVPDDSTLTERFEQAFRERPDQFAPILPE